jgi:hypothetical protein
VIFGVVRSVDLVVDVVIGIVERDVPLDAARSDPTFVIAQRRDLELFCRPDLGELIARRCVVIGAAP